MSSKFLARKHIAQVNLDERQGDSEEGVAQGDAGVRVGPWIDDDECNAVGLRGVNLPDQFMLRIALEREQFMALGEGKRLEFGLDNLQRGRTVYSRLARAKKIQVRTI